MNVYAASDLHGNLPPVPSDADLLLLAGDICPDFSPPQSQHWGAVDETGFQQANWLDGKFRRWLNKTACRVVATWGNHDFVGEKRAMVESLHLPWTLLIDNEIEVVETPGEGLRIWGTPWVPHLPRWAFNADADALAARAGIIPSGIDILMPHGPPYGVADYIPGGSKYGNVGAEHVGDSSLNDAIKRVRPRFVICGHIHEAYGIYHVPLGNDECSIMNVAAVDEFYTLRPKPFTRVYGL